MFRQAEFVKSAVHKADYPKSRLPEVAILGRSNCGKSSFINAFCGGARAKVSSSPGKTQTLNFFKVADDFFFVDVPGYGFARRPAAQRESWKLMVEGYLEHRKNLMGALLLMDVARPWTETETQLEEWLVRHGRKVLILANKADRLNQKERAGAQRALETSTRNPFLLISARTGSNMEGVRDFLRDEWRLL